MKKTKYKKSIGKIQMSRKIIQGTLILATKNNLKEKRCWPMGQLWPQTG